MTTHAPLRSRRTKAQSVCHVQGLGDGDAPTSPSKDTRLFPVACRPLLGAVLGEVLRRPPRHSALTFLLTSGAPEPHPPLCTTDTAAVD